MAVAVMGNAGGTAQDTRGNGKSQPVVSVPFVRASAEHIEPAGIDVSKTLTTSDQDLGVFDVPAYGYVRGLYILVTASGGTGGTPSVTATENGVFDALKNIYLTEPNGAIIAQFNTGYDLYLANKWGGYDVPLAADLKASPSYANVGSTGASFSCLYRIPVELNLRDALGSLPNQNAAATFKLRLTLAANTAIGTGTWPTTLPNVRVRVYLDAWDQPEVSSAGQVNQIEPPAMDTTQFWTSQTYTVNAGLNTIRFTRVGNFLRNLILVHKASSRSAGETNWATVDPLTLYIDSRPVLIYNPTVWSHIMWRRTGYGSTGAAKEAALGLDNGVRTYDFTHDFDGQLGRENRDLWVPTLGSTRLEIQGNFANAGTLTVLTNDVAIAGNVFLG